MTDQELLERLAANHRRLATLEAEYWTQRALAENERNELHIEAWRRRITQETIAEKLGVRRQRVAQLQRAARDTLPEEQRKRFQAQAGMTPETFEEAWARDEIEDSAENMALHIDAFALLERERRKDT